MKRRAQYARIRSINASSYVILINFITLSRRLRPDVFSGSTSLSFKKNKNFWYETKNLV